MGRKNSMKEIKKPIQLFFEVEQGKKDFFYVLKIGVFDYKRNRQNFIATYLDPKITAMDLILNINNSIKQLNKDLKIRNKKRNKNNETH